MNLRDQFKYEFKNAIMIKMMNLGIIFKLLLFNFCHMNNDYHYVQFLFELTYPQENTVVYVYKESKHLFCLIEIGTDVLLLNGNE